jgi:tetratricopeptide (TPR) repeat protein
MGQNRISTLCAGKKCDGEALSLSDVMVRNMENRNDSLDSMTRRRLLVKLLEIPPALLGLDSLYFLTQEQSETILVMGSSNTTNLEAMTLEQYRIFLSLFWDLSRTSQAQDKLGDVLQLIHQLKARCFQGSERQRQQSKELLFHYHQFVAVVTNDQRKYQIVLHHLNQAMQLAQELQDPQLLEVALLRRGWAYIELKDYSRAIADLERAAACTNPKLRGLILLGSSHAHAHMARDDADKLAVMHMLDEVASIVRRGIFEHDEHFLDLVPEVYHIDRAGALLILKRPCDVSEALESIELAARDVSPDRTRRHARLNIYKASIYAQQGDYPQATTLALSALPGMKAVKSAINIERIAQLYEQLHSSSYGDTVDVVQLGRDVGSVAP